MNNTSNFSVIYCSNGHIDPLLAQRCLSVLYGGVHYHGGELIAVTWHPVKLAHHNIVWSEHRLAHANLYNQILAGLTAASNQHIIVAEHDVLYPLTYYREAITQIKQSNQLCYNHHVLHLTINGFFSSTSGNLLSNLASPKTILRQAIHRKLAEIAKLGQVHVTEPGDTNNITTYRSSIPTIDIRHGRNLTGMRAPATGEFIRSIPYWGEHRSWIN